MKYTKGGVFRKFAFIGYKNKEEAENAVQYFDKSFIDTTKIVVSVHLDQVLNWKLSLLRAVDLVFKEQKL